MIKKVNVLGGSQQDYLNMAIIEEMDNDGWELRAVTGDIDLSVRLGVPLWAIFYKPDVKPEPIQVKTVEEAEKAVDSGKVVVKKKVKKRVKSKIKKDWK